MLTRKKFMDFIPEPKNEEVLLYNDELQELIDHDVLLEYKKEYKIFLEKRERFLVLKKSFEEYHNYIDSMYLFRKDWNEKDYLKALQDDKKTYSKLYEEIKKKETAIDVLKNKAASMQNRINIQIAKEEKDLEIKKDGIDQDIEVNKQKLEYYKNKTSDLKADLELLNKRINNNENEFKDLQEMNDKLCKGTYKCDLCGHIIRSAGPESRIYARLCRMLEINKEELETLLAKKKNLDIEINNCEVEIKKIRDNLQNDISFKRESKNFYHKKSLDVLKLEALYDDIIKNIYALENELKNNPQTKEDTFIELKERIKKCEISLENLKKIRLFKTEKKSEIDEYNQLKYEIKEKMQYLDKLKAFLIIYFKMYEKKANDYCLNLIQFKIYEFNDYELTEKLDIYYKGTLYEELNKEQKDEADRILIDKFEIYL